MAPRILAKKRKTDDPPKPIPWARPLPLLAALTFAAAGCEYQQYPPYENCVADSRCDDMRKLKAVVDSAPDNQFASMNIGFREENLSDERVKLDLELATVLARMGLSGNEIFDALNQVESPYAERMFRVKTEPSKSDFEALSEILKKAERLTNNANDQNVVFDCDNSFLVFTASQK